MVQAQRIAAISGIRCEGLTETGGGIVGALAGLGLRRAGEDGRFLGLPGLRELKGAYPVAQICSAGHIDRVCTLDGLDLAPETLVDVGEWVRPVLRSGLATLCVEEQNHDKFTGFISLAPKQRKAKIQRKIRGKEICSAR